jgi:hypothetical protein
MTAFLPSRFPQGYTPGIIRQYVGQQRTPAANPAPA